MVLNQQGGCSMHLCKRWHFTSLLHGSLWNKTINISPHCCVLAFKSLQWFGEDKALPWGLPGPIFWDLAENPGYLIVWLISMVY